MTKPVNKIEKLIAEFCPEGVEWKELGDVCDYVDYRGKTPKKTADGIFLVTAKNIRRGYIDYNTSQEFISEQDYNLVMRRGFPEIGDVLITTEAPCGFVAQVDRKNIALAQRVIKYRSNNDLLDNSFLKHYLLGNQFQQKLDIKATGSTVKGIKGSKLHKLTIPIPPLAIQQEIVKILDTFTALEAELEAELEARKKQYEYYRDRLLTPIDDTVVSGKWPENSDSVVSGKWLMNNEEVEWKTLGEVGKFIRGTAITAKETTTGKIPVVANAPKPIYFHSESNRNGETIVVARSGAYAGLVSFWSQPIFLTDAFSLHLDAAFLKTKFVYYLLKQKQETIHSMKKGSGVPHVRVKEFESYPIPIPPLAEQERIVAILDKFDALVNDISVGLPAELGARRKQYEYYRGKLLTFKGKNES